MHREQLLVAEPQAEELALALNLTLALPPALTSSPSPPAPKPEARSPKPEARSPTPKQAEAEELIRRCEQRGVPLSMKVTAAVLRGVPQDRTTAACLKGFPNPETAYLAAVRAERHEAQLLREVARRRRWGAEGPPRAVEVVAEPEPVRRPRLTLTFPLTLIKPSPNPHPSPRNTICPAPRRGALAVLGRRPG